MRLYDSLNYETKEKRWGEWGGFQVPPHRQYYEGATCPRCQGCCAVAWGRFEPVTLGLQCTEHTTTPHMELSTAKPQLTNKQETQTVPTREREWHADWQRNRDGADRGRQKIRIHSTQQNRNPDEFQAKVEMTYYTEWETDRQGERQRKKQTEQLKQLLSFIRISINITWVNKRENSQPGRRTQLHKTSYYILCPSAHLIVCPSTSPFTFLSIQCTSTSVCPSVSVYMPLHLSVSLSFFQYTRDTSPVQI